MSLHVCALAVCLSGAAGSQDSADAPSRREPPKSEWSARRARGELVPGKTRYVGETRASGQSESHPATLTTTVLDRGTSWILHDQWTFPDSNSTMVAMSAVEKGTLFLLRYRFHAGITRAEWRVEDGWVIGWTGTEDSPDPREQIYIDIDAHEPIFAHGAGVPQVIATLPLRRGYTKTFWNVDPPDRVVSRTLEVVGSEEVEIPAGTFRAWKVEVSPPSSGNGATETLWVDTRSRRVLRYDSHSQIGSADWTLFLEP